MDPPGYLKGLKVEPPTISHSLLTTSRADAAVSGDRAALFQRRAMEIAQAQMGSVFQVGLMLYFFVGNQLQLFSLFFLASLGSTPVVNLLNVSNAFASVSNAGVNLTIPKAIYIGLNSVGTAILVWKLRAMGLLPVTSADWVSLLPPRHAAEHSAAAQHFS